MLKKIQNKFLATFVLFVTVTLIITIYVGYRKANDVYQKLNDSITKTEYIKIASDLESTLSEIVKVMNSEIVPKLSFVKALQQNRDFSLERIESVRELSKNASLIFNNYPNVVSFYILLENQDLLVFSKNHVRSLNLKDGYTVSENVLSAARKTSSHYSIIGDTCSSDFPLDDDNNCYLTFCQKLTPVYNSAVIMLNLKEEAVFSSYSDFITDDLRDILVADENGMIVSSADKNRIGESTSDYDEETHSFRAKNDNERITSFIPVNGFNLMIVGSLPKALYEDELYPVLRMILFCFLACMLATSTLFYLWIRKRLKPLRELHASMKRAGRGDYSDKLVPMGNDELTEIVNGYNAMLKGLEQLELSQKAHEKELRELEMSALRNEINPHFLYNSLNTIKCMANIEGNMDVARCTVALGSIVGSLYKVKEPCWTISEETKLIEKYIEIMNIRFGGGILFEKHIPEEISGKMIPKFILQPIIENSILHGFEKSAFHGTIRLEAMEEKGEVIIKVDDDGCGVAEKQLAKMNDMVDSGEETKSIGLKNVSRRIALRCGKQYGLSFGNSSLGGLAVKMNLPDTWEQYE